jgi:hypothetical protein
MKWWKYILDFLVTPLGTPISFVVWYSIAFDPESFRRIISDLPKSILYAAPIAYIVSFLICIPAILILSRNMRISFRAIVLVGTIIGTITGLITGFHIGGYDINGMIDYFSYDLTSIYAPSMISGMVCSIIYWVLRTISLREN